mmetsp:Transcript_45068/g.100826  ORF Transcript_45068/g.100826 Transcript_45068/m.100826 type:complete len:85 (+) Transcript_45068:1065-1319(+)
MQGSQPIRAYPADLPNSSSQGTCVRAQARKTADVDHYDPRRAGDMEMHAPGQSYPQEPCAPTSPMANSVPCVLAGQINEDEAHA